MAIKLPGNVAKASRYNETSSDKQDEGVQRNKGYATEGERREENSTLGGVAVSLCFRRKGGSSTLTLKKALPRKSTPVPMKDLSSIRVAWMIAYQPRLTVSGS